MEAAGTGTLCFIRLHALVYTTPLVEHALCLAFAEPEATTPTNRPPSPAIALPLGVSPLRKTSLHGYRSLNRRKTWAGAKTTEKRTAPLPQQNLQLQAAAVAPRLRRLVSAVVGTSLCRRPCHPFARLTTNTARWCRPSSNPRNPRLPLRPVDRKRRGEQSTATLKWRAVAPLCERLHSALAARRRARKARVTGRC
jgi:hypothetical protein